MARRKTLVKKDLIKRLAAKGYTQTAANVIWTDVVEVLEEALIGGDDVKFIGFGKLAVRDIKERRSVHPATGNSIVIPAYKTVRFIPGGRLKEELANGFIRS